MVTSRSRFEIDPVADEAGSDMNKAYTNSMCVHRQMSAQYWEILFPGVCTHKHTHTQTVVDKGEIFKERLIKFWETASKGIVKRLATLELGRALPKSKWLSSSSY